MLEKAFFLDGNYLSKNQNKSLNINSNERFPLSGLNKEVQQIEDDIILEEIKNIMKNPVMDVIDEDYIDTDSIYIIKNKRDSNIELQSTENSTKTYSLLPEKENPNFEKKETDFYKIISFKTVLRRKRGRKGKEESSKKKNKKCHNSDDFDNIQRKIQVHFIKFLVNLANDAIKSIFGKETKISFKDIKYELKKNISYKYFKKLKSSNYGDIIQKTISPKNKNFDKDANEKVFLTICDNSEILKNLFAQNYLYIFQKYYYGLKKEEKEIYFNCIKIILSSKTKGFYDIVRKNENNQKKFNEVVNNVYFSEKNYLSEQKFITINC